MNVRSKLTHWVVVTFCVACFSCSPSPEYLSEPDLHAFISADERLTKSINMDEKRIRVAYRPTDLMVAQDILRISSATGQDILEARARYERYHYFVLSFSIGGRELVNPDAVGQAGFSGMLHTFSFGMGEVIDMTTSAGDTIAVADYLHTRTFGIAASSDVLVVFDKSRIGNAEWIDINISEFGFGTGKQSFRFETRDLENVPKIFRL